MAAEVDQHKMNGIVEEITNEDPEIEILNESQSPNNLSRESSTHETKNRSVSVETIGSSDNDSRRRSCRISKMKLPNGIYVKEKQNDCSIYKKKPTKIYQKRKTIDEEKRLLEKERIQIEKERKLLEREKKLLEREKREALRKERARKRENQPSTSSINSYKYLPLSTNGFRQINGLVSYDQYSIMNPNDNESEANSTTVRDYLKTHLNIQRGQTSQFPPLRTFKQRKPSTIPQSINVLTNRETSSTMSPLDRLFSKKQPLQSPHYIPVPQISSASISTPATVYSSDSYRKMLNTVNGIEHPSRFPMNRNLHNLNCNRLASMRQKILDEDESDEFDEESTMSCELFKSDDEDIEVLYDSGSTPPPTKVNRQMNKRDNRTLVTDITITNVKPLDLNGILEKANAVSRKSTNKKILPKITNVTPLNLNDILGSSNSSYSKEGSREIIEIGDESPQRQLEYTPSITGIKPLDLSALLSGSNDKSDENVESNEESIQDLPIQSNIQNNSTIELNETNDSSKIDQQTENLNDSNKELMEVGVKNDEVENANSLFDKNLTSNELQKESESKDDEECVNDIQLEPKLNEK